MAGVSFAQVRRFLADHIAARRGEIDAALARVVPGMELRAVLHYYTRNVDTEMFPLVMIEQVSESSEWVAMPAVRNDRFTCVIWGLVHWDRDDEFDDLLAEFAASVRNALNQEHEARPLDDGHWLYFKEVCPVSSVNYGSASFGQTVLRAWNVTWQADVFVYSPDARPAEPGSLVQPTFPYNPRP